PARQAGRAVAPLSSRTAAGADPSLELDVRFSGPDGRIGLEGARVPGGPGTLEARANGAVLAEVTVEGDEYRMGAPGGVALTAAEEAAVRALLAGTERALGIFDALTGVVVLR